MKVIEFKDVWEKYRIKFIRNKIVTWDEFWALQNINFTVTKGEIVGIIGENGAGKTTLLKLIAGMLIPDKGTVETKGRISSLMELGAGFHPELTGRENIYFNANLYGISAEEIEEKIEEIVEFVGIGNFIDAPIKYYSSGMYLRLAFGLAIHVEPDIFLIDDILAVGDEEAQIKCLKKIFELRDSDKTVILVSHDMNMIKKLCDRAVFLDKGRLVQEGPPQKIISRYLETVGEDKGIEELKRGDLGILFNNGKIFINWKDSPLTKYSGLYCSFFHSDTNTRIFSIDLDWKIAGKDKDKIIAKGIYHYLPATVIWEIEIKDDRRFKWTVSIESEEASFTDKQIFFMCPSEYKEWITLESRQNFLPFSFKNKWQEMNLGAYQGHIVVLGNADFNQGNDLPYLGIEFPEKDCHLKVLNTGYDVEGRVIEGDFTGENPFSGTVRILPEEKEFSLYIEKAEGDFKKRQEELEKELISLRSISRGSLIIYADIETKALRIFYSGKEITKRNGLHSCFIVNERLYDTSLCEWKMEKKDNHLFITLSWEELSFIQKWDLSFNKEDEFSWEIILESKGDIKFNILKAGISFQGDYKNWFCSYQEESFPQQFGSWQDMLLIDNRNKLFGLRKEGNLPAVIMDYRKNAENIYPLIQNSDREVRCRLLQIYEENKSLAGGRQIFCKGKVKVLEDGTVIDVFKKDFAASNFIGEGDFKVYADIREKRVKIYYKDKEITKRSGLNSIFMVNNRWYDICSSDNWMIEKKDNQLFLSFSWVSLPLIEKWKLLFVNMELLWEINCEFAQPLKFELFKAGLNVVPDYKKWFCSYQEGKFPADFNFWEDMPLEDKKAKILGVKKEENMPSVILSKLGGDNGIFPLIQNSDDKLKCRILQFYFSDKEFSAGRYNCFSGEISFLNDGSVIKQQKQLFIASHTISKNGLKVYADVKEKKVKIYYGDKEITKGNGLNNSFFINNRWFGLSSADNMVVEKKNEELLFSFSWDALFLSEKWKLSLGGNNKLLWEITFEARQSAKLDIFKAGINLVPAYKEWFSSYQKGRFPENFNLWEDMPLKDKGAKLFGVRKVMDYPAVIFENNQGFSDIIQNSDRENKFRNLELSLSGENLKGKKQIPFLITIEINNDETELINYINKERQERLLKVKELRIQKRIQRQRLERKRRLEAERLEKQRRLEAERLEKQRRLEAERLEKRRKIEEQRLEIQKRIEKEKLQTISSGDYRLFIDSDKKRFSLFYKKKELTAGRGLYSKIYVEEQRWHLHSFDAEWQVEKISEKELRVTLSYKNKNVDVNKIWKFKWGEHNTLENEIIIEISKPISLANREIGLELKGTYKKWETPYEKSNFSACQFTGDIAPGRLLNYKISSVLLKSDPGSLPDIFFEVSSKTHVQLFSPYKRKDRNGEYACFDFSPIIPKKETKVEPGRYTYGKAKIALGEKVQFKKEAASAHIINISKGHLNFAFEKNMSRKILYRDKELTTGLGIYTSIRSSGIWHDSYQPVWQVKNNGRDKITAVGNWPYLPISQIWKVEVRKADLIYWKVEMEVYEVINLEIEQTNIMVSPNYKKWIIPGMMQGDFIDQYTSDYDILPYRFWNGPASNAGIGVSGDKCPSLFFKCNLKDKHLQAIVENSDIFYQGRLLQYQKNNPEMVLPGKFTYFEGEIKIAPDE